MTTQLAAAAIYPRCTEIGGSRAYCGPAFMVSVTRPFTAGEDAVMAWCRAQDDIVLHDWLPLLDGRDLMVLERLHTKQSYPAALREQEEHIIRLNAIRRIPKQHDTRG